MREQRGVHCRFERFLLLRECAWICIGCATEGLGIPGIAVFVMAAAESL